MSKGGYNRKTVDVSVTHSNLEQEVIVVTNDKLKLALMEHLADVQKSKQWIAPSGFLLTLLIVFSTTEFKTKFGLSADSWKAIFLILAVGSAAWLLRSIWLSRNSVNLTIDELIDRIKS